MRLTIRQDDSNSLFYVWLDDLVMLSPSKVSRGYKHRQSAELFAEGYESGWNLCRVKVIDTVRHQEAVVR